MISKSAIGEDLTPADRSNHAALGIEPDLLGTAGVRRVTDAQARELGLSGPAHRDLGGVVYPYLDPATGQRHTCRVRRDHPEIEDGKAKDKYLSAFGDRKHLYLTAAKPETLTDLTVPVVFVEAEKAALVVRSVSDRMGRPLAPVATGGCWGWRGRIGKAEDQNGGRVDEVGPLADLSRFNWAGRVAVILFDSNATTNPKVRQARRRFAEELDSRGARVKIGTVPADPGVNGPDDYRATHDDEALLRLIDAAAPVQPATVDELLEDCGVITLPTPCDASQAEPVIRSVRDALCGADALRMSAVRSKLVSLLKDRGLRDAARLVDSAIGSTKDGDASGNSKPALVPETQPWSEPVNGAAVLDAVLALVLRHVVVPQLAGAAFVLWILHTYAMDAWQNSPILAVTSPTKRCGKSTLLSVALALVYRPLVGANVTAPVMFRVIEAEHPTLLLDEADCWLHDEASDLRSVVNSGHTRSTAVTLRLVGDNHEPKQFSTWAPKLIAMIGKPPDTILDRSVVVPMRRKAGKESVKRLRSRHLEIEALPIRQQLRRWADDQLVNLANAEPAVPEALSDRAADSWRPLLAIADALGGAWPKLARQAALDLSGRGNDAEDDGLPIQVLSDIRQVFADAGNPDAIPTKEILAALTGADERPWRTVSRGQPLDDNRLGRMLRPFGVTTHNVRVGSRVLKGYHLSDLRDPFGRYLPPASAAEPATPLQPNEFGPEPADPSRYTVDPVAGQEMRLSSMIPASVAGVAGSTTCRRAEEEDVARDHRDLPGRDSEEPEDTWLDL